jgi:7,8-dihydropterin-6-yl-methyl-4-(beta-D-ribofuranosyl)aminobenzene 5'-phosphate synthase
LKIRITVVVENTAAGAGVLGEHGLALWIDTGSHRVLFDTGQTGVVLQNAARLQVPLDHADAIVLSHGHYDHTGGLAELLRDNQATPVYAHPAAFQPKFMRRDDGTVRVVGMPDDAKRIARGQRANVFETLEPTPVPGGLMVTGPIPRETDFEDTGGAFFLDRECRHPDPLQDDQALFFESERGTVVLLGCAHAGAVNTLRYARELTGNKPIHAVIGGMHLVKASSERLGRTIEELRHCGVERVGAAHCTGMAATAALWNAFPGACFACHVGSVIEFELP